VTTNDNQPLQDAGQPCPAVIDIWPDTAKVLRMGRDAAYRAAKAGQIPTLRLGRRLMVPTGRLADMLGTDLAHIAEALAR
jgi:hypothetical protein